MDPVPLIVDSRIGPAPEGVSLSASARCHAGVLSIQFELRAGGSFLRGLLPAPRDHEALHSEANAELALRQNGLWNETCFEAFVEKPGSTGYYEFNASVNGAWNLYEFDSYRSGMREVALGEETAPVFALRDLFQDRWILRWDIPVMLVAGVPKSARLGLTAVLKCGTDVSYWALRHPGERPDFHLREGFCHDPVRD